jgi:hypothetical protein
VHGKREDIPVVFEDGLTIDREAEWGSMTVAFEAFPAGTDTTPLFKNAPNGACPSPHWGYLLKGKMRIKYADHEEVITAGEAYYLSAGHNLVAEEDCEIVQFSQGG